MAIEKNVNHSTRTYMQTLKEPRFSSAKLFVMSIDLSAVFLKIYTTRPENKDMYMVCARMLLTHFHTIQAEPVIK